MFQFYCGELFLRCLVRYAVVTPHRTSVLFIAVQRNLVLSKLSAEIDIIFWYTYDIISTSVYDMMIHEYYHITGKSTINRNRACLYERVCHVVKL